MITTIFFHDNVAKVYPTVSRSICEDDESFANTDLLRVDVDSDDSSCSSDTMASYNSESQTSETLLIHSNIIGKLDDLSQSHSYTKASPLSHTSQSCQSALHSLSQDSKIFSVPVNSLGGSDTSRVRENKRKLVHMASRSSFIDLSNSIGLSRSTSVDSKTWSTMQDSNSTTYASTTVRSASSLSDISVDSSRRPVPAAIIFANQCLERSKQRSILKLSSISSHLITNKSLSIEPSPIPSHKLMPHSSVVPCEIPVTMQKVEKLLSDISQPSSRVQQLKRELRAMEIKCCRQKCVRSLKKSMVLYTKLNSTSESKHSRISTSVCSVLCCESKHVKRRRVVSTSRAISSAAIETLCFSLILSMVYMLFFLYKDSLSNIITPLTVRGIFTNSNKF